jgi:hypothetical protein
MLIATNESTEPEVPVMTATPGTGITLFHSQDVTTGGRPPDGDIAAEFCGRAKEGACRDSGYKMSFGTCGATSGVSLAGGEDDLG